MTGEPIDLDRIERGVRKAAEEIERLSRRHLIMELMQCLRNGEQDSERYQQLVREARLRGIHFPDRGKQHKKGPWDTS